MAELSASPAKENPMPEPESAALLAFVNPKEDPTIVDFITHGFFAGVQAWRAKLQGNYAMVVSGGVLSGDQLGFLQLQLRDIVTKDEVTITPVGKASVLWFGNAVTRAGMTVKATFQIGSRSLKGILTPAALERYEAWKKG